MEELSLHTVCQEALCPNLGPCWSSGNVSFMILGSRCTRRCGFCAVETARPDPVDDSEPFRLSQAVKRLQLRHAVITSPARDDLADEGAGHFARCVAEILKRSPRTRVEVLTPDFHARRELIEQVIRSGPAVYNHNLETVKRLTPRVRPQGRYERSLQVLRLAGELGRGAVKMKSGLMVGLGEEPEEVRQALTDLREAGCEVVTIGQYLRPTPRHLPVHGFVTPDRFDRYRDWARELGFFHVQSGPYVRSSYHAYEALQPGDLNADRS